MKRIIVIGCPGSGKSRFSKELHDKTGIPLHHLDMMYWNADKTTVDMNIFLKRLTDVIEGDSWIIDGNYASTLEMRMEACDTVVFLDYPTDICLEGIVARRGKTRSDMPWIETEEDLEFTEYVKGFNKQGRPQIIELLKKYNEKKILIFRSREQADAFFCDEQS